jgi:PAS domain S-box-containing protein
MSDNDLQRELDLARQEAAEARTMTEALISSLGEGLIIVNEYGTITEINDYALQILGYEREELINQWLPDVIPSVDKQGNKIPTTERPIMIALMSGKSMPNTVHYLRKDGAIITVTGTASPFTSRGKPMGGVIIFRDYTREMQVERAKDEFVSLASHQLRTPLTSIRLFAELLLQSDTGNLTQRQKDYINKIILSTTRMIDLVSDFLNISRLELGELRIQNESTNLEGLISAQIEEFVPIAEANGVRLTFITPRAAPMMVETDPKLLSQVIHNLIANSIRYSPPNEGLVTVKLKKLSKSYRIEVIDNGIGIPADVSHRIFERFFRAENALRTHGEGTGLGLYLAKSIIEALGGKIWHKSEEGQGTTFYLEIPFDNHKS